MKVKSIYKSVLLRGDWPNEIHLKSAKARRIKLQAAPNRVFFAHKDEYGNWRISEAYSGAVVHADCYKVTLKSVIEQANNKIANQLPDKFKTFDEFVEDFIIRHGYLPLKVNLRVFNS